MRYILFVICILAVQLWPSNGCLAAKHEMVEEEVALLKEINAKLASDSFVLDEHTQLQMAKVLCEQAELLRQRTESEEGATTDEQPGKAPLGQLLAQFGRLCASILVGGPHQSELHSALEAMRAQTAYWVRRSGGREALVRQIRAQIEREQDAEADQETRLEAQMLDRLAQKAPPYSRLGQLLHHSQQLASGTARQVKLSALNLWAHMVGPDGQLDVQLDACPVQQPLSSSEKHESNAHNLGERRRRKKRFNFLYRRMATGRRHEEGIARRAEEEQRPRYEMDEAGQLLLVLAAAGHVLFTQVAAAAGCTSAGPYFVVPLLVATFWTRCFARQI